MLIGCYTAPDGNGSGLVVAGGPQAATPSPSFALKDHDHVYAVNELTDGTVSSFRYDTLEPVSTVPTGGAAPCHLAVHPSGHVLVANYGSGSVSVHAIGPDGALSAYTHLEEHTGSGPDPDRQQGPHCHQILIAPDGAVTVVDLGLDRLVHYDLHGGRLVRTGETSVPPGTGPRHALVHKSGTTYLVGELSSQVLALRDGVVTASVPATGFDGHNQPSGIGTDGELLYVANRGADTVAVFAIEPQLRRIGEVSSGGKWPRDLVVADGRLHVANQNSDTVVTFTLGAAPEPTGEVFRTGSPTSVIL